MHVLVGRVLSLVLLGWESLLPGWLSARGGSQPQEPLRVLLGVTHPSSAKKTKIFFCVVTPPLRNFLY